MEVYERVNPGADDILLLLDLARELETGQPSTEKLLTLQADLEEAIERYRPPEIRSPLCAAMFLCRDWQELDWLRTGSPCEGKERRSDERLIAKVVLHDIEQLRTAASNGLSVSKALAGLGPLWPLGEPIWKTARWPTRTDLEARIARILCDDAPELPSRPAPLELSSLVPEVFHELVGGPVFDLVYRAEYEVTDPGAESGERSMQILRPREHKIRYPVPGTHGFREQPEADALEQFRRATAHVPSLGLLYAFYREHDGALLFRPLKGTDEDAHVQWLGLADQAAAMDQVVYVMEGIDREPERVQTFMRKMGCDLESVHCLALIDASFFLVPLKGHAAGQVFRYSFRANQVSRFAATVEEAVALFVRKVAQLSGRFAPLVALGDESRGGAATQMKLVAVKIRK